MTNSNHSPQGPEAKPLLVLEDLHTAFAAGSVVAVDGIDLAVGPGEAVGLVGESGCGKSAAAKSILRLHDPKSVQIGPGRILFEGRDLLALPEGQMRTIRGGEIAMIFQDPMTSLNPVMTIGDQIGECLDAHNRRPKSERRQRIVELLELVGIPSAEKRVEWYPHQFSGGMRQRAMIAIALSSDPKLILADEITTALDVTLQAQILELIRSLSETMQLATIMITHDLGIVAGMTDRVYVMYAGQIVETARTSDLFENPGMPYTWGLLRSAPDLDAPVAERMVPIEGMPPSLAHPPQGCRFAPRCPYRRDICVKKAPSLGSLPAQDDDHKSRCWGTQDVDEGGWLIGQDWKTYDGDPAVLEEIRTDAPPVIGSRTRESSDG